MDDGADGTDLIEIQRPESKKVKGRAGTIYGEHGLHGTCFAMLRIAFMVCVRMCVCVCPSSAVAWPPNHGDAEAF